MPLCCFPRVFLASRSTLVEREGWRSLWLRVRCTGAHFCLLGSFVNWRFRSCSLVANSCYLLYPGWLSLLNSARSARCWGGRAFRRRFFSVLGCLSHLISARSARRWGGWVDRVPLQLGPPWPPDLRLWKPGECLSSLLVNWLSCAVLLLTLSLCFPCTVSGRDAVCMDRLVCWLTLCGRCAIVGGLRTASAFTVFALVVSVWLVAVF